MNDVRAILFDWDGTLLDSYASGFRASMAVYRHFGLACDRERFEATYSPNWYVTYEVLGLPASEWPRADRLWFETYQLHPPELYPFARRTLEHLRRSGYFLGLVTSGNRERVRAELARHKIESYFSTVVCFEDTREKKPYPAPLRMALAAIGASPRQSVYVGDRPEDVLMGRNAGAYTIAVESAYGTRASIEAARPNALLPHAGHLCARFGPSLPASEGAAPRAEADHEGETPLFRDES